MAQLRRDYQQFINLNTEIIAIGPETNRVFTDWWHEHQMPFIGIADPEHTLANKYGQQVKLLKLGRLPSLFVIDREGQIRFQHQGESMGDIPQNEAVLSLLGILNGEFEKR